MRGGDLGPVVDAWAARTPSRAVRETSRIDGQGAAAARPAAVAVLPGLPAAAPRPVVLGAVAAATGLGPAALARVVGYDDVQTVVAAALKLRPLDPAVATGWVVDACSATSRPWWLRSPTLVTPDDIPARQRPADRAVRRGPRHHDPEVVQCLRRPAHPDVPCDSASAARSAPARAR